MSEETLQEKFERLQSMVAQGGAGKARAADELIDILRELVYPDYGMGGPGLWTVEIDIGDQWHSEKEKFGPFASAEEANQWGGEHSSFFWLTSRVKHPKDYKKGEGDE